MKKHLPIFSLLAVSFVSLFALHLFNKPVIKNISEQAVLGVSTHQPFKVGIQVGHWKNRELPEELAAIRENDGAFGAGKKEWQIGYSIATLTAQKLQAKGYQVDILPSTILPGYSADAFIAIHADENATEDLSGFKMSASAFDQSGKASTLNQFIEKSYQQATNMSEDDHYTRAMSEYYAFNYTKFQHAINPKTPAILIETGFLPNKNDQKILIDHPNLAADGIANGVEQFLSAN